MTELQQEQMLADSRTVDLRVNKAALIFLFHIRLAIKIAKLYEPGNTLTQKQIHSLFKVLQAFLQKEKSAALLLRQSTLFFNGFRIRFSFKNYDLFRFMSKEMKNRGVGLITFLPGLSEEEVRSFVYLLAKKVAQTEDPFHEFLAELERAGITHVDIQEISPFDVYEGSEKAAVKVFFLGIAHLKELFDKFKTNQPLTINVTRRLMHSLFNHIANDEAFLMGLTTIKNFDDYTLNHSLNTCILSIALGRRMGLDRNELTDLGISAFFHDYGKMEIPKEILDKQGKLAEEEWKLVESHPHIGAEKLLHLKEVSPVPVGAINVAMEHHIREDFSGYPHYQKKKNVSLFSKIVRVCDVFDALTTTRPYRERAFKRSEALSFMTAGECAGFDPIILKVFVQMLGPFPVGSLVQMDTGEVGIVMELNPEPLLAHRPRVKLITDKDGQKIDGELIDTAEKDPEDKVFLRSIVKTLMPYKYNVYVADYFLARAEAD